MSTIIQAANRFGSKVRSMFGTNKVEMPAIDLEQYLTLSVDTAGGEETFYVSRYMQENIEHFFRSDVNREYELVSATELEINDELYHRVKITSKCLRYSLTGIVGNNGVFTVRGFSRRSV